MYYFIKLFIRTLVMVIPAIIVGIFGFIGLIGFSINNVAYSVFNYPSYWDIENEWNALMEQGANWYSFWLYGFNSNDG